MESVIWLEDRLSRYTGILLLVSHSQGTYGRLAYSFDSTRFRRLHGFGVWIVLKAADCS